MTQQGKSLPSITPAWVAGLLAGQDRCEWAAWFRVHHEDRESYRTSDPYPLSWPGYYTPMLMECIERLEGEGYTVSQGGPNAYVLDIGAAVISGKPDVIAVRGDDCVVVDLLGRDPLPSDEVHVRIHMCALPRVMPQMEGIAPRGQLQYRQEVVDVPASSVPPDFIMSLSELAERLVQGEPPVRVPSPGECGRCDITPGDCAARMEDPDAGFFRFPDPADHDDYILLLDRVRWTEADRDRMHEARVRAEARVSELEEEIRRIRAL